jgi:hypothetical protein
MYTASRHSFAPVACFVVEAEADVVAGVLQDFIFMLFGQVRVSITEVINSGSAEETDLKVWRP